MIPSSPFVAIKKEPIKSDSIDSGNVSDYGGGGSSSYYNNNNNIETSSVRSNIGINSSELSFTDDDEHNISNPSNSHHHEYIDIADLFTVDDKRITTQNNNHQMDFQTTFNSNNSNNQNENNDDRDINTPKLKFENNSYENTTIQHTSQGIEMAVADEIELPSPWVDVAVLASKPVLPTAPVVSACVAIPTEIPSYVNLPFNLNTVATNYIGEIQSPSQQRQQQQLQHIINDDHATNFQNLNIDDFDLDNDKTTSNIINNSSKETSNNIFDTSTDNIIESLLMETNEMVDGPTEELDQDVIAAQQMEADAILTEILKSIDSVQQQSKAMMAAQQQFDQQDEQQQSTIPKTSDKATQSSLFEIEECSVKVECDSTVSGCCKSRTITSKKPNNRYTNERPKGLNTRQTRNLITSLAISPCCATKSNNNKSETIASSASTKCTCKSPNEGISNGCCVVICLKTLEHIRNALNSSTVNLIRCSSGGVV